MHVITGHFMHGLAHLCLVYYTVPEERIIQGDRLYIAKAVFGHFFFFYFLLKGKSNHLTLTFGSLLFMVLIIPQNLAFMYAQIILSLVQAFSEISTSTKDPYYSARALILGILINAVPWVEALGCDSFLVKIGGHVWLDNSIPIAYLTYFFYMRKISVK